MTLLEPHITSGLGVSFKADNDRYVSVVGRSGRRKIEAQKEYKDPWTKFTIEKIDNDNIYLKAIDGRYLSRVHRGGVDFIEAAKWSPDSACKFRVYEIEGKIVFKADNNKYLGRVYRSSQQNIEAAKWSVDPTARFIVETGALLPVKEEIESIEWGKASIPTDTEPKVIAEKGQRNPGSREIVKNFIFERTLTTTQSTNWEHSWGVTTGISFTSEAGVSVGAASAKTSLTLSAEISYNGKKGGNEGKTNSLKLSDQTTVFIPPGKFVKVKFMATTVQGVIIPFTATIKRTSEIGVTRIKEKGEWKGVMVYNSYIDVEERNI